MIRDLGWANAQGETEKEIIRVVALCHAKGHNRTDVDHSNHRGTDHEVSCTECGYVYHYDSGD